MNSLSFILVLLQFIRYIILFPISIYFLLRNSTFWFYTPCIVVFYHIKFEDKNETKLKIIDGISEEHVTEVGTEK